MAAHGGLLRQTSMQDLSTRRRRAVQGVRGCGGGGGVSYPTLIRQMLTTGASLSEHEVRGWLRHVGLQVDEPHIPLLAKAGSGAEVLLAVQFIRKPDTRIDPIRNVWTNGDITLELQAPCRMYRIDLLVMRGDWKLAIEVDGAEWHQSSELQVQADYLRQRRIVASGYRVIRFTAREIFRDARECWRQVEASLGGKS